MSDSIVRLKSMFARTCFDWASTAACPSQKCAAHFHFFLCFVPTRHKQSASHFTIFNLRCGVHTFKTNFVKQPPMNYQQ